MGESNQTNLVGTWSGMAKLYNHTMALSKTFILHYMSLKLGTFRVRCLESDLHLKNYETITYFPSLRLMNSC